MVPHAKEIGHQLSEQNEQHKKKRTARRKMCYLAMDINIGIGTTVTFKMRKKNEQKKKTNRKKGPKGRTKKKRTVHFLNATHHFKKYRVFVHCHVSHKYKYLLFIDECRQFRSSRTKVASG